MFLIHLHAPNHKMLYWDGLCFQDEKSLNLFANSTKFREGLVRTELENAKEYQKDNSLQGSIVVKNLAGIIINPFKTVSPRAHLDANRSATEFYIALQHPNGYFISSKAFVRESNASPILLDDEDVIYTRETLIEGYNTFVSALRNEEIYSSGIILQIFNKSAVAVHTPMRHQQN